MQIDIKEVEQCKLAITYQADAEQIMNKRAEVMNAFKKAPVPGFRKGKASPDAIRMHYRQQIEESVKRGLAEDAYHNTLFEKKLRPHGAPRFNTMLMEGGKFTCEFDLNTKPDFEPASYKDLVFPKPNSQSNVAEITEKFLQDLRLKYGEVVPYSDTDFIQMGDNVIVNYDGFLNDVKIDSLSAEGEMLTVGVSNLLDFDNNLLGMFMGETRAFNVVVPDTGLPSLAGKTVLLKVTLVIGSKTTPAALDDELAKKLDKQNLTELRQFVRTAGEAQAAVNAKKIMSDTVANRLVSDNLFIVPNWLTLSEAQYLAHNSKMDWDTLADQDKEKYMEMAERNVRLSLILDKIRDVEPEAQLTDQEVFEVIKRNLVDSKMNTSMDDVMKELTRTGYLQILFSRIRDEYVLDFIVKNSKVVE